IHISSFLYFRTYHRFVQYLFFKQALKRSINNSQTIPKQCSNEKMVNLPQAGGKEPAATPDDRGFSHFTGPCPQRRGGQKGGGRQERNVIICFRIQNKPKALP
ncbi:hypothetical protein AALA83_12720, partial [Oscillospiraceae bacterium 44-5]